MAGGSAASRLFALTVAGAVVVVAAFAWLAPSPRRATDRERAAITPVDPAAERKRALFAAAEARPSDPALQALYADIAERHFGGSLPAVAVKWQDDLSELDSADGYTLEGMTDGKTILVSSTLEEKDDELRRTLCHEAVHVKLQGSAAAARHDAVFQQELRRVFESGCFEAILASADEQAALKQWLDAESARLKEQGAALDAEREALDREVREINDAIEDLNARMAEANARGTGWPVPSERETLQARSARAAERKSAFNAAVERHNQDTGEFARRAERYRLMLVYPRGVDDGSLD